MSASATSEFFATASNVAFTQSDMTNVAGDVIHITNNVFVINGSANTESFPPQIQSLMLASMLNNTNNVLRGPSNTTTDQNVRVNDGNVAPPAGPTNEDVSIAVAQEDANGPLASSTLAESAAPKVPVRWHCRVAAYIGKMRRKMKSSRA